MALEDLSRIIQVMHHGVVVHDAEGRIRLANQAAADDLGLTLDQIHGRTSLDPAWHVIHEDGTPFPGEQHPSMVSLMTGEPQRDVIMGVYRGDGTLAWLNVNSEPLLKEDGCSLEGVVVTFINVTGQVNSEINLAIYEQRYQQLTEYAHDMISHHNRMGEYLYASTACKRLLGYEPDEMIGRSPYEFLHPDDVNNVEKAHAGVLNNEKNIVCYRHLHRDGHYIWLETTASFIADDKEDGGEIIAISRDVTERIEAEEKLRASQEQLNKAEKIALLGSWDWDLKTNAVSWSDQNFRNFGYEPGEVKVEYELFSSAIHPDDRDYVNQSISNALENAETYSFAYRMLLHNGEVRHFMAEGNVERDEAGRPVRVFGTAQDVTRWVEMETALRASERLFRAFFEYAPFGAVLSDRHGKIFQTNLEIQKMFGFTEQEFLNLHFRDYTVDEDIGQNVQLF